MRTKLLTIAGTGIVGLLLGSGIGVAVAQNDDTAPPPAGGYESMDEMHTAMRDQMPGDIAEQCDQMHAAMPEAMRDTSPTDMGSMMDGQEASGLGAGHAEHHG